MNEDQISGIEHVIAEVKRPIVLFLESSPYAFVPDGYMRESLEALLPKPVRKIAAVTLDDSASFIDYTNKHGLRDTCVIYSKSDYVKQSATLTAVINDHGTLDESTAWRDHTATFSPIKTVEWTRWNGKSGSAMDQLSFATWIEDNLQDIASVEGMPSGTDMLKMALEFEANHDKRFKQKINTTNGGVRLEYIDDETTDTRKQMAVFDRFAIGVRVFLNGPAYQVQARLRYKQNSDKVSFWFELIRPDRVFESALNDEIAKIKEETGFVILMGAHK